MLISTLHRYLAKDLVKVALLAAAALTLILTTIAVIEPMRKQGLSPVQVLRLFWYTLPVMLSLTLPIAALFAATMVYGRFSQDNELTACRASGIGTLSLLKPAVVMGVVVTCLTLALSFGLAPLLARLGEKAGKENLKGLIYQQLRTRAYFKMGPWLVHADEANPETWALNGVVAVDTGGQNENDIRYLVASSAYVIFPEEGNPQYVTFKLIYPSVGRQGAFSSMEEVQQTLAWPMPSLVKDDPAFYDWRMLRAIKDAPQNSPSVQLELEKIRQQLYTSRLYEQVAGVLNGRDAAGRPAPYTLNSKSNQRQYVFRAPRAFLEKDKWLVMEAAAPDQPVTVEVLEDGRGTRTIQCRRAMLRTSYGINAEEAQISAEMTNVVIQAPDQRVQMDQYVIGPLDMPPDIHKEIQSVTLDDLYHHLERFPAVAGSLKTLHTAADLEPQEEDRRRDQFSLRLRRGMLPAGGPGGGPGVDLPGRADPRAFAISCVPALVLVIVTFAGKQVIEQPRVATYNGLALLWAGVGILGVMLAGVYGRLLRR